MEKAIGILFITWIQLTIVHGNCPIAECSCLDSSTGTGRTIDCRDKNLQAVPNINATDEIFQEITFSSSNPGCRETKPPSCSNKITDIPSNAFVGLKVIKIDFSNNILATVDDNAFNSLEIILSELLLEGDGQSLVPFPCLTNLTNLVSLTIESFTLNSNGIISLPQDFSNLEKLVLHSLQLEFISEDSVAGRLRSLKRIEILDNPKFTIYPINALRHLNTLEHIRFVKNGMEELQAVGNAFESHLNLKELDLSHNKIHTLQHGCFDNIDSRLEYLGLHLNILSAQSLTPLGGGNWTHLQQLILASNFLNVGLPNNLFTNMPSLANLNVQQAQITVVEENDFKGLHNLHFLHLSGNPITEIHPRTFLHTPNLKDLYLDDTGNINNKLNFSIDTTKGLQKLERLELKSALIEPNPFWESLPAMPELKHLILSSTSLSVIPDLAFQYNTLLQSIEMNSNGLTSLTQAQIHGPGNSLTSLDLSSNSISLIDKCVVQDWATLDNLFLAGNPLNCDCQMLDLYHWAKNKLASDSLFPYILQAKCKNLNDRMLTDLDASDLVCPGGTQPIECLTITTSTSTTTTASTPQITTPPLPTITKLFIDSRNERNIQISWIVTGGVKEFYITKNVLGSSNAPKIRVDSTARQKTLQITSHYDYDICISAKSTDNRVTVPICEISKGLLTTLPPTAMPPSGLTSGEIAAIGACSGLLLILIIVILFFLLRYQTRPKYKDTPPVQFTNARPSAGNDAKRFSKPKKSSQANGDIIISAISSGKAGAASSPDSRHSAGSYQYLNENQMLDIQPHLKYENGAHGISSNKNPPSYNRKQPEQQGYLKGYNSKDPPEYLKSSSQNANKSRYDKTPGQLNGQVPTKPHSYVNDPQQTPDSVYTNDIKDRPLPKVRTKNYENNSAGFLNHGFDIDSTTDHTYNEIPETRI